VQGNKKTKHYKLTKKGHELRPVLEELGKWSISCLKNKHSQMLSKQVFLELSQSI
jgi:DNA-binding HxlR family transcriptional regulator